MLSGPDDRAQAAVRWRPRGGGCVGRPRGCAAGSRHTTGTRGGPRGAVRPPSSQSVQALAPDGLARNRREAPARRVLLSPVRLSQTSVPMTDAPQHGYDLAEDLGLVA